MARAFQTEGIPYYHTLASCLLTINAVGELMLRRIRVVNKAVFTNQCATVRPTEGVKSWLTLDVDVAEYGVDACNAPADGVLLRNNLNFGVLGEVDALNFLQQVLTCKQECSLRNVLTSEEQLGKGNQLLDSPLACVLQLALELPADALGEVHELLSEFRNIHGQLTFLTCPKGAVSCTLEVQNGLLGNHSLCEVEVLLLCLEVVRHDLVHAALLQVHNRGLRNDEVGVNLFLRLIQGIAKKFNLGASRNCRSAALCRSICFRTIDGAANRIACCSVTTCNKEHEVFAWGCSAAVCFVTIHATHKQGVIVARNLLVVALQGENERVSVSCGNGCVHSQRCTLFVNHVVLDFGRCDLYFLCFQHERHQGGVLTLETEQLFVDVCLNEVSGCDATACVCKAAHGGTLTGYLRLQAGTSGCGGDCSSSTYVYIFCHCLKIFRGLKKYNNLETYLVSRSTNLPRPIPPVAADTLLTVVA